MFVEQSQKIHLTPDEVNEAIIDGLRKKHKKLFPADLDLSQVDIRFEGLAEDNLEVAGVIISLPPAKNPAYHPITAEDKTAE